MTSFNFDEEVSHAIESNFPFDMIDKQLPKCNIDVEHS